MKAVLVVVFVLLAVEVVWSPPAGAQGFQTRGYGEFLVAYYDYPENFYRDREHGPQRDKRLAADISHFALEASRPLGGGLVAEFELTVKHQGVVGRAEPNFGGPFNEERHGSTSAGAVELSKFLLARRFGDSVSLYGGRIPVAFGQLVFQDTPMDYIGTQPFEAETRMIPADWSGLGVALSVEAANLTSTTEVVEGLDSSGFNSYGFVSGGVQGRFGTTRVTEPALVQRLDVASTLGVKFGGSVYYGETSENRPTSDMARTCDHAERVAACGYTHAALTMFDLHAGYLGPRWRGNAMAILGRLKNAASVNAANQKDRTNLPDLPTPVGEKAFGGAAEVGVNVAADPAAERYEPFLRYERIDTMWRPAVPGGKNPVANRTVIAAGVSLRPSSTFYAKADYSRRGFHDAALSYESAFTVTSGFRF